MKYTFALALALVSCPVWVQAQSASPDRESKVDEARERFRRGVDLYHEGSLDAALAELQRAYDLAPNYRLLFNLGQVQFERHDYVAALAFFDAYLEQGGGDIANDRRRQVENTRSQLKARVASLSVETTVDDVALLIDGVPAGTLPQVNPVLVNAGVHQLQLRKEGFDTLTHTLTIAGNESVRLELPLKAPPVQAPARVRLDRAELDRADDQAAAPIPDAPRAEPSQAPLWISLFATAAMGGGALAFGLLARSADAELGRELNQFPADRTRAAELRDQIQLDAALCDGLAAGAIVAAGLSVYFALSGARSPEHTQRAAASGFALSARGIEFERRF